MQENEIEQAVTMTETQKEIVIATDGERYNAVELRKTIRKRRNLVVEFFRDTKDKAHKTWKAIVSQEKGFTDRLDKADGEIEFAVSKYDTEQEILRKAEQKKLQDKVNADAERERERLEKRAAKLKTPAKKEEATKQAAAVVAQTVSLPSTIIKSNGVSSRKTWKAKIIDETLIPRRFLIVNTSALNDYARATKGNQHVAGVEFYEHSGTAIRV